MSAPKFTPWKVGGRVGATAREGLVGLYAIDRAEPNKYQGPGVGYAHSLADAKLAAAAPELYAALEMLVRFHESEPHPGLSSWHEWLARSLADARSALGRAAPDA